MQLIIILLIIFQLEIIAFALYQWKDKFSLKKSSLRHATFIDTSVLMDGRIIAAVTAGFVPSTLVITKSVLAELQLLADGSDSDKRARARHGLDVAKIIQEALFLKTIVYDDGSVKNGVDERLLEIAKANDGSICTIDFNLNKVATAQSIRVLNINELAQQLRMNHLPGERVSIIVQQKGSDKKQGVGYLADGTMVVIDDAQRDLGKTIHIEFIRSLQTAAGRMLFAKKVHESLESKSGNVDKKPSVKKSSNRSKKLKVQKPEDSLIELVNEQTD